MMRKDFYSVKELSELFMVNVQTIRRWIETGRLTGKKLGHNYRVSDAALKEFLGDEHYHGVIDTLPSFPVEEQEGMKRI